LMPFAIGSALVYARMFPLEDLIRHLPVYTFCHGTRCRIYKSEICLGCPASRKLLVTLKRKPSTSTFCYGDACRHCEAFASLEAAQQAIHDNPILILNAAGVQLKV